MLAAQELNEKLSSFIEASPCNFLAVEKQASQLESAGYVQLLESEEWNIELGGKYFVTRNGSALIAFRVPSTMPTSFMLMASHSDSPALRVKPNPEIKTSGYTTLNVEIYGSALMSTWFDRPLSVCGRIVVSQDGNLVVKNVSVGRDLLIIPSLAIHMNRDANKGYAFNVQKDLQPLFGAGSEKELLQIVARAADVSLENIVSHELVLYNRMRPSVWGSESEFISAPRLDDLQCAFASLEGFLASESAGASSIPVHVVFDNEEVGSGTKQGAASTFLKDTLKRAVQSLGGDKELFKRMIAQSLMLSADNAHALHPNYPEKSDPVNQPVMGEGVVLKHAANQHYTTDAVSAALCKELAAKAGVQIQEFVNRSDSPGGSTLGNISSAQLPIITADIGVAQLAMHSCYETCSSKDTESLVLLANQLFSSSLEEVSSGLYKLS